MPRRSPAPAAVALRPARGRGGGVRRTRSVRRRVGGPHAGRAPARSSRCSSRSPGLYGATRSDAFALRADRRSRGVTWTSEDADPRGARHPRRPEPVHAGHERALEAAGSSDPGDPRRVGHGRAARRGPGRRSPSASPLLAWQVGADRYLVDEDGMLFGRIDADLARGRGGAARGRRPARRRGGHRRGSARSTPSSSTPPGGSARCARPTSARPPRRSRSSSTTPDGFSLHGRPGRLVRGVRVLHADAAHDRPDPGPGPAAAQHARGPRGRRPAGDPRRRPQRHLRAAGRRLAIAGPKPAKTPKPTKSPAP